MTSDKKYYDSTLIILFVLLIVGALGRDILICILNRTPSISGNVEVRFHWRRIIDIYNTVYSGILIAVSVLSVVAACMNRIRTPIRKQFIAFLLFLVLLCIFALLFGFMDKTANQTFNGDYSLFFSATTAVIDMVAAFVIMSVIQIIRNKIRKKS